MSSALCRQPRMLLYSVAVFLGLGASAIGQTPNGALPRAPAPSSDLFAANLGIFYQLVPYGMSFGARLTQAPLAGSPAAQLQLEPGDMIVTMDGQPIQGPNDVLQHVQRTDLIFINIRTGLPQSGVVFLPAQVPPPGPGPMPPGPGPVPPEPGPGPIPPSPLPFPPGPVPPPLPPPGAFMLGITTLEVVVSPQPVVGPGGVLIGGVGAPQRGLQASTVGVGGPASRAGLLPNDVIFSANGYPTETNEALRRVAALSGGVVTLEVARQAVYGNRSRIVVDMRPTPVPGGLIDPNLPNPGAGAPGLGAPVGAPAPRPGTPPGR